MALEVLARLVANDEFMSTIIFFFKKMICLLWTSEWCFTKLRAYTILLQAKMAMVIMVYILLQLSSATSNLHYTFGPQCPDHFCHY